MLVHQWAMLLVMVVACLPLTVLFPVIQLMVVHPLQWMQWMLRWVPLWMQLWIKVVLQLVKLPQCLWMTLELAWLKQVKMMSLSI
jgi:hypothetical protein